MIEFNEKAEALIKEFLFIGVKFNGQWGDVESRLTSAIISRLERDYPYLAAYCSSAAIKDGVQLNVTVDKSAGDTGRVNFTVIFSTQDYRKFTVKSLTFKE